MISAILAPLAAAATTGRPETQIVPTIHNTKNQRQQGHELFLQDVRNPLVPERCASCRRPGHATASSLQCPNHPTNNKEFFSKFMPGSEKYTRVVDLRETLRPDLPQQAVAHLQTSIHRDSRFVSDVLARCQLVLTDFLLMNPTANCKNLFSQNGYYTLTRIVRGTIPRPQNQQRRRGAPPRRRQNPNVPVEALQRHFDALAVISPPMAHFHPGFASQLSIACKTQAANNKEHVSTLFDKRVKDFTKFHLAQLLHADEKPPKAKVSTAIQDYVYERFCMHPVLEIEVVQNPPAQGAANRTRGRRRGAGGARRGGAGAANQAAGAAEDQGADVPTEPPEGAQQGVGNDQVGDDQQAANGPAMRAITVADLPETIPAEWRDRVLQVLQKVADIKPITMRQLTPVTIARQPENLIEPLVNIMRSYDDCKKQSTLQGNQLRDVPTFNLLPQPSFHKRFVTISAETAQQLLPSHRIMHEPAQSNSDAMSIDSRLTDAMSVDPVAEANDDDDDDDNDDDDDDDQANDERANPLENAPFARTLQWFWDVFRMDRFGWASFEEMQSSVLYGKAFAGTMMTNGTELHVHFVRFAPSSRRPQLKDKDLAGVGLSNAIVGIDPGRKVVMTGAHAPVAELLGLPCAIRRTSMDEYQAVSGETKRRIALESRKTEPLHDPPGPGTTISEIETLLPSGRTANAAEYRCRVAYLLQHEQQLRQFYGDDHSEARFAAYRGRQRAIAKSINRMITGSDKYGQQPDRQQTPVEIRRRQVRRWTNRRLRRMAAPRRRLARFIKKQQQIDNALEAAQRSLAELDQAVKRERREWQKNVSLADAGFWAALAAQHDAQRQNLTAIVTHLQQQQAEHVAGREMWLARPPPLK
ncbi:hypothetical protein BC940DRAFT_118360 [Gongronella butleri]|nr:hypothetical protein BC940DRAFT_118360 [Gongronella butleri]